MVHSSQPSVININNQLLSRTQTPQGDTHEVFKSVTTIARYNVRVIPKREPQEDSQEDSPEDSQPSDDQQTDHSDSEDYNNVRSDEGSTRSRRKRDKKKSGARRSDLTKRGKGDRAS